METNEPPDRLALIAKAHRKVVSANRGTADKPNFMKKKCPACGKRFSPTVGRQKYCTKCGSKRKANSYARKVEWQIENTHNGGNDAYSGFEST